MSSSAAYATIAQPTKVNCRLRVVEGGRKHGRSLGASAHMGSRQASAVMRATLAIVVALFATCLAKDFCQHRHRQAVLGSASYESVLVVSGDTLWSIASRHDLEGLTTAEVVSHIRDINQLESARLTPGMRIQVPV